MPGGQLALAPVRFAQKAIEDERQNDAGTPEDVKTESPTVVLREPCADPTAEDRADVHAGLVKRQCPRASVTPVVIAGQRNRSGEVKRFAASLKRPHGNELPELRAPTGRYGDKAPEETASQNQVFAPHSITYEPR